MKIVIKNKVTLTIAGEKTIVYRGDTIIIDDYVALKEDLVARYIKFPHHISILEYPKEDIGETKQKSKTKTPLEVERAYEAKCFVC